MRTTRFAATAALCILSAWFVAVSPPALATDGAGSQAAAPPPSCSMSPEPVATLGGATYMALGGTGYDDFWAVGTDAASGAKLTADH